MVKLKYANKTPSNIINHWHECLTRRNLDRKFASSTSNSCLRASSFRASDRALRWTSKITTAPPTWHHKWLCLNLQILQHTEWDGANPLYNLLNASKTLPIYNKPAGINSSPPLHWLMRLLIKIYSNMSMNLCILSMWIQAITPNMNASPRKSEAACTAFSSLSGRISTSVAWL